MLAETEDVGVEAVDTVETTDQVVDVTVTDETDAQVVDVTAVMVGKVAEASLLSPHLSIASTFLSQRHWKAC